MDWGGNMEFRQLRYFIAVAEDQNLSAASRKLNVSQPPVTRQIHQLEAELGVSLFSRTSKGVELTVAGAAFLPEARKLIEQSVRAAERSVAAARGQIGRLDVGYFGSTIYQIVPSVIRRFRLAMPEVAVHLRRASKDKQVSLLRDRRLGVGFARYYALEPDMESICVTQERLYIARDATSPRARATPVSFSDLRDDRLIVFPQIGRPSFADEILRLLNAADTYPRLVEYAEDVSAALALAAISGGACIVPESVAILRWPGLVFSPIANVEAVSPVNCVFLRHDREPAVDAFAKLLATLA